jgi:hypothetical protein
MLAQSERIRSYVDPATNEMLIADFDLLNYLNWVKGRPVQGSELLANFLHEWTHRWCFNSSVGNALALLRLRAGTRTLQGFSSFDDHVRCMAATTLLEPIAEGLSLFAEFDTYPGKSPWLSQTLVATSVYFSPAINTDNRPELLVQGMLQKLRRDPKLLERKAGIYAQKGFNPYLIGYLSVKSLWTQMAAACDAFNDRDLFLSYLRSYIYDDPGMVLVLLQPAHSEVHAAQHIANHLSNRMRELISFKNLSDNIACWLSSAETGRIDVTTIGSNEDAEQESLQLLNQALVEDLINKSGNENVVAWIYMTLEERSICVLGSSPVKMQLTDGNLINIFDTQTKTLIYTVDEPELADHDTGELFILGTSNACGLLSIIGIDQQAFLVNSFGDFSESDLTLAKRLVANKSISQGFLEEIRKELAKDNVAAYIWSLIRERIEPALKAIFGPLCTLNASADVWEQTFEKLLELGLHGMLGQNGELTRALAAIGLLNSFTSEIGIIQSFAPVLDIDEESINEALQLDKQFELPVIAKSGSSVIALV